MVQAAAVLLSEAFEDDPTVTYTVPSMNREQRLEFLPRYMTALLSSAAMNNAIFDQVDDWKSCGVLMPPGCKYDNTWTMCQAGFLPILWATGLEGCRRMISELSPLTKACKAKALREDERYYYVFFLGTRKDGRGRGLCSALVRHYQSIAARDRLPIYLEAATQYCLGLYLKLGFVVVDELRLGKGKVDIDGEPCRDGPGFCIWGMIWRPL